MTADVGSLFEHAHATRVAVIGGGIAGLVAAREFAKVGMTVTLLEATDRLGGAIRSGEVDGIALDLGAESFATRGGHVRRLIDELGLGDAVVEPNRAGAWVAGLPGGKAAPLPKGGILGIPANPFAEDVRRVIGWAGAWRAYLDRLRPPLTIGHERSLGRLVRSRLGSAVLDRLVAPVTSGVYSARPDDIDPDIAAPGLNAALTRAGSLTGAVAELTAARSGEGKAPGAAVQGLAGGIGRLVDALAASLREQGVDLRTTTPVASLDRAGGGWRIRVGEETVEADVVIVATEESAARALLAPHVPGLAAEPPAPGPVVHVVTLVLDAPELAAAPRGTGVLTVPGAFRAKALTHASAKWSWIAERAGSRRQVVRVSFGAQGEAPVTDGMADDEIAALAVEEASALLGVPLKRAQLRGFAIARFAQSQPAATIGLREATERTREAIRSVPSLGAAGAWLAGTGLAQVVPDAAEEADRVRRGALFG
ncbi:protoporphyrinogen oxidase [Microbacterium paludicola]|uniref:Coproporphyrinogen III oxidase n=1 Tax=Microbacterium paludicola TaxID=300019 RepID=A0A4Y9FTM1_9MICO|nr:protoporphyrinogen oxidase [Microbacterium paludicola]MBF0816716.1 protoporphyrinogen oxidase [Microbacterium paludicola]TFU32595.1 protoporphyrinogen oxidase [Microbacterium paludicola]